MTTKQQDVLADIFENSSSMQEKAKIRFEPTSRSVIILIEDLDDEWFHELQEPAT